MSFTFWNCSSFVLIYAYIFLSVFYRFYWESFRVYVPVVLTRNALEGCVNVRKDIEFFVIQDDVLVKL